MKKRITILTLLCLLGLLLFGVFEGAQHYELAESSEEIEWIDIVFVPVEHTEAVLGGHYDVLDVVGSINVSRHKEFIASLTSLPGRYFWSDYNEAIEGNVIMITYRDGTTEIITQNYGIYDGANNRGWNTLFRFDEEAFCSLVGNAD